MEFNGINLTNLTITVPILPDAPIIGVATAVNSTTATVSFTAPSYTGTDPITSYTAVSTPYGFTGTLNQSGSGTITVTGLTAGFSYTFSVYATSSVGNSQNSASSNSILIELSSPIVSSKFYDSIILDRTAKIWVWGYNNSGELGRDDRVSRSSPIQLGTDSWASLITGNQATYGIKSDGTLWSWGNQFGSGSLGINSSINRSSPTQIGSATNWTLLAEPGNPGGGTVGAINNLGQLFAWGANDYGTLGQNYITPRSNPVQIAGSWVMATIGYGTGIAINNLGNLFTWGKNTSGQLGSNNTVNRSSPVQIMATTSFVLVSASDDNQAAIDTLGRLWIWGSNIQGTLGNNSTITRSSPVQIAGSWNSVSVGDLYVFAIRNDSTLWTWGLNNYGQLGNNTRINRSSPIQIGTSSWTSISAGEYGPIGVTISNTVFVWGKDFAGSTIMGRIGAGVIVDRSTPYQIGSTAF